MHACMHACKSAAAAARPFIQYILLLSLVYVEGGGGGGVSMEREQLSLLFRKDDSNGSSSRGRVTLFSDKKRKITARENSFAISMPGYVVFRCCRVFTPNVKTRQSSECCYYSLTISFSINNTRNW